MVNVSEQYIACSTVSLPANNAVAPGSPQYSIEELSAFSVMHTSPSYILLVGDEPIGIQHRCIRIEQASILGDQFSDIALSHPHHPTHHHRRWRSRRPLQCGHELTP